MSDTNDDEQTDASVADDAVFPESDTSAAKPSVKSGGGGAIAWLALLLSLVAAAGASYLVYENWRARSVASDEESSAAALSGRIDGVDITTASLAESITALQTSIDSLGERDARIATELGQAEQRVEERLRLYDSMPPRMANLENSVASLQGTSAGARELWLLAEAEYYMQIANAQLQLAGNPELAALALRQADDRLVQIANPALTTVRQAVADELAALELMEKPDLEGATLTLSSLAMVAESLPLRSIEQQAETEEPEGESEPGAFARAWGQIREATSDLVRVTPPEELKSPLLTPDAEPLIRSNLALQLQAARLALLRGEQAMFEQSLDDADGWLALYFEPSNTQVESARATIAEIRGNMRDVQAPDISDSLQLLRQYQVLAEPAQ